jgi:hypothetical protein
LPNEQVQYRSMARSLRRNRFAAGDVASLILRVSLTTTLATLSMSADTVSTPLSVGAAMLGCLVGSGFLARGAAAMSLVLIVVVDHDDLIALVPMSAEACSLVLVGAGALSLDALVLRRRLPEWRHRR